MIIRKKYKFEAAHIVRDCSSKRCSKTIHGHSYAVEFLLHSNTLDNGGMVVDFGLLKNNLGDFADSFDHTLMVWTADSTALEVAHSSSERVITSPYNLTAENMAKIFYMGAVGILNSMVFQNSEGKISVHSVIVHETTTGYAQADVTDVYESDYERLLDKLEFSSAIQEDWKDANLDTYIKQGYFGDCELILPFEV